MPYVCITGEIGKDSGGVMKERGTVKIGLSLV